MSVTVQAGVHLGKEYSEKLRSTRNQPTKSLKQLLQLTGKLIKDQKEITSIPVIDLHRQMWQRTTLLTDKAVQFATAKTCVFSGEPMEFEFNISQDSLHWEFSRRFKRWWLTSNANLSISKEGSSSCQCKTTLNGENKGTEKFVLRILLMLQIMLENSRKGIGRSRAWIRKEVVRNSRTQPNGEWDEVAEMMMINFSESGQTCFSGIQCYQESRFEEQRKRKVDFSFQWQRRNH